MKTNYTLSIVIPSRNEEWLSETVEDILKHTGDKTEIIVALDGQWPVKPLPQHERVTILYLPESIGQRAATKQCARLSTAKYIAKTDAHVALDDDFDTKMIKAMEELGEDTTLIPCMRNMHVFSWVCKNGHKRYQSPSGPCQEAGCGLPTEKEVCWIPKTNPLSVSYCFDSEPHFQYFKEYTRTEKFKEERKSGYTETMSIQGSFFMMTREKYWELNPDDESLGSWGSQGINVAARTWLSGGKVMVNHNTWYGHLFRTQGGDFGFPYPNPGHAMERAKKMSKDLFFGNNWQKQTRPLSWLLERFWPVKGWSDVEYAKIKEEGEKFKAKMEIKASGIIKEDKAIPTKGIIYYTDNRPDPRILTACQEQIKKAGLPIVSTSLNPIAFGKNFVVEGERGDTTMFRQILKALEESDSDIIYMCEHDVLYHPSHFDFTPPDRTKVYYNQNTWQTRVSDGFAVRYTCKTLSQLCAYRDILIKHYRERMRRIETEGRYDGNMGYEPGAANRAERVDNLISETFESAGSNADLRHGKNLTRSKWSPEEFRHQRYCRNWQNGTTPKWAEEIVRSFST